MSATARLPEHPPHPEHVHCTEMIAATRAAAPPAPEPEKPGTAVDLPVPQTSWGPFDAGQLLALESIRALDAEGRERHARALAEAKAAGDREIAARQARWSRLAEAVAPGAETPEGHQLAVRVIDGGTYLTIEAIPQKPAAPARRGS